MARQSQTASIDQAAESDEESPQRGATRAPVRRPVRLQFDDAIDVVEAVCHNVSIGGMFVHSSEGRPVGGLVRFELLLEDEASIRGLAEVVWMRSQDHGPERVAGMGLKFRFLEQRDRQLIFKLVSQHIKERLAARHPGLSEDQAEEEAPQPPPIRAPASTVERVSRTTDSSAQAPEPPPGHENLYETAEALPSIDEYGSDYGQPDFDSSHPDEPAEDESGQRRLTFGGAGRASVDAFDGGDQPSRAWMQDGLSEEPSPVDVTLGGREDHDAAGYDSHLYEDEEHFERRPKPRRDLPVLTVVALLVTALAVSAYLWGDRWFGGDDRAQDATPSPAAAAEREPQADEASDASPPDSSGSESAGPTEPAAEQDTERDAEPRVVDTGLPFVPAEPVTPPAADDRDTASPPPPSEPTVSRSAASSLPFRTVSDITARVAGPAVEIVITTDGRISADRFSHARISGGAPRELIRLRGLSRRFETESIPVGIGAVRQVRTGWHRRSSGNELHVVIDLSSPTAKVTNVRVEGRTIVATIR